MQNTISRLLANLSIKNDLNALRLIFNPIGDRMSSQSLNSAGLAIKAGGSAIVKTGSTAWVGCARGVFVSKAAATDMAALAGTVVNATFNCWAFFVDSAGTVTSVLGTAGATLAAMKLPSMPEGKALLGFVIINPTGTGDFVGGTTALDDATVAPGAIYVNTVGAFDPTILL